MIFKHFDVFALIFWVANEQPTDPVSSDTVLCLRCSVLEVFAKIFDCAFVVVKAFTFAEYWLVYVSDV
ncbi:hypothetical protein DJ83_12710 [Halorubrum ezzemoulense]|uniref:Uncharacterized protein n=1 Tax=Halorubrum ezzemoulense TaxID=337243 RepID=A0A256ISR3_HALEZ|nr:hypothetical protein DJ83_12710 [Halorubrum ezzemoulense]